MKIKVKFPCCLDEAYLTEQEYDIIKNRVCFCGNNHFCLGKNLIVESKIETEKE